MQFEPRNRIKLLRSEGASAGATPVFQTEASEVAGIEFWGTMKKIVLATVLAALGSASALAADLGPRAYTKAPMMAEPVSSWQGFYIGGNVGYGWGAGRSSSTGILDGFDDVGPWSHDTKSKGVLGGAQIGYNWQAGSFVTGLEGDFQGAGIKGSFKSPFFDLDAHKVVPGPFISADQKLSWFGTVRGRLGVTVTPDLLLYSTGGLAYGQVDVSADTLLILTNHYPISLSKTRVGWTAGAGAEWMFAHNWSAKLEYLHLDLGKQTADAHSTDPGIPIAHIGYTWRTQENIVRAGVNYHF
jgi:outer membrane immunogenic protein